MINNKIIYMDNEEFEETKNIRSSKIQKIIIGINKQTCSEDN